jgi:outer membrane protein OmpA-like peptidoglycan-associated protein
MFCFTRIPKLGGIVWVFMVISGVVYAQESKVSFGFGGEISGGLKVEETKVYESGGGFNGAVEYRFNNLFSGGLKTKVNNDFKYRITAFEQSIFARWYIWRPSFLSIFAELSPGGIFVVRGNEVWSSLEISVAAGVRFSFGNWYVEPYLATGYPIWGRLGVMVGYRVPAPGPAQSSAPAPQRVEPRPVEQPVSSEEPRSGVPVPNTPVYVIFFPANRGDFNGLEANLAEENSRKLTEAGNTLKAHPEYRLLVEGHANPTTRTDEEERFELVPLSRQRAETVADALVREGVDRKQLIIAGSGGVNSNTSDENQNRRVDLTLMYH